MVTYEPPLDPQGSLSLVQNRPKKLLHTATTSTSKPPELCKFLKEVLFYIDI